MNKDRKERILTKLAEQKTASLPRYLANMAAKGQHAKLIKPGVRSATPAGHAHRSRAAYMNAQLNKAKQGRKAALLKATRAPGSASSSVAKQYAVHATSAARMEGRRAKRVGNMMLGRVPNRPLPSLRG